MMNSTQAVFSVALTSLAMGTADPVLLGTAAIASQFPDLDTSKSVIGRLPILHWVSCWIEKRYTHRTLTHSFIFSLGLAVVTAPIALWNQPLWSDRTYISGLLMIEDAEDLVLPNYPDRFNPIRIQPGRGISSVHLEAANLKEIINVLGDYSARGSLIVRSMDVQS
jgi:hypothetical protein